MNGTAHAHGAGQTRHRGVDRPGPPPPLEPTTLTAVMDDFARRGFTEQFTAVPGGLRARTRRTIVPSSEAVVTEYRRFEGVSDPDDMAILYAVEARGVRGTLVDAFGVYADPAVAEVMDHITVRARGTGAGAAPATGGRHG